MTGHDTAPLLAVLRDPTLMAGLPPAHWDLLVRQARHAGLLGRLHTLAHDAGLAAQLPAAPAAHLAAAHRHAAAQADEARHEVAQVWQALRGLHVPVVLLKGAAYLMAGLPPASGRTFTDIDILVPKAALVEAESALLFHGWLTTHHDPYDQRYYREWMHELPPMLHRQRGTVLDMHHGILPETARLRPSAEKLIAAARPLADEPLLQVLAPADMVLHSMVHLLHNEEMGRGLRDLSDLDLLLRHFAATPGFWEGLVVRADELGLQRVLYYGLTEGHALLHTPVPVPVLQAVARHAPPPPLRGAMHVLWRRALGPLHASTTDALTPLALGAVVLRAHWLRMPPALLCRHLMVKGWRRLTERAEASAETPAPRV